MKLWLLRLLDARLWDKQSCMCCAIVRAESEGEARSLTAAKAGDEGREVWQRTEHSSCVELPFDGGPGIIQCEFLSVGC